MRWQGHAHALRVWEGDAKKEGELIRPVCVTQSSKKQDCVLSSMGMKSLGATVLETEWNGTANPPRPPLAPPPRPLNQEWSRAKEKTQTRHINILDMGGRGWGLNFPPWCFVQDCISKKAWRRLRKMEKSCRRTLSNSSYQHANILKTGKREKWIFIYKSLIHGDSWILSSLFLTCKIKVDASVLFTCYMFHSVTEKLSVHKQS